VIGLYWYTHHLMFQHIRRWDGGLILINLVLLMFVAFLPFPVALFGAFRRNPIAVAFYTSSIALTGLVQSLLWWYASAKHRLVDPAMEPRRVRFIQFPGARASAGDGRLDAAGIRQPDRFDAELDRDRPRDAPDRALDREPPAPEATAPAVGPGAPLARLSESHH